MNNNKVDIENARIRFKNFSGKAGKYNAEGNRNFCVLLDDQLAEILKEEGYNVKYLKPIDEEEPPQAYLPVGVRFDKYPPKIVLVTSRGQTILTEETVQALDYADLSKIDIRITPSHWEKNDGTTGIKAYLKIMYATLEEDPFESKYLDTPDSAMSSIIES